MTPDDTTKAAKEAPKLTEYRIYASRLHANDDAAEGATPAKMQLTLLGSAHASYAAQAVRILHAEGTDVAGLNLIVIAASAHHALVPRVETATRLVL